MPRQIPVHRPYGAPPPPRPTLCVDFHGVIHSHASSDDGVHVADDPPVPGAFDFLHAALVHFRVAILSARFSRPGAERIESMRSAGEWFRRHGWTGPLSSDPTAHLYLATFKPPCLVQLDDRGITFEGTFPDPAELLGFKPWNKR